MFLFFWNNAEDSSWQNNFCFRQKMFRLETMFFQSFILYAALPYQN